MIKIDDIAEIIEKYKNAKESSDVFNIIYKLSLLFETFDIEKDTFSKSILKKSIDIVNDILLDDIFVSNLKFILTESPGKILNDEFQRSFEGEISQKEAKIFLNASILLSTFVLSFFYKI